jgi:drug/metabolite transporter (DMT)-like permease
MADRHLARRDGIVGVALVVVSAVSYGTVPILAKLTFRTGVALPEFLFWRFAIAACLLWLVVAVTRGRLPGRDRILALVLMGAVGYAGQSAAFFAALERIPAATTALLLYTYPAIVTLAAAALLHERLTVRKVCAIVIAFAGTSMIVQGQLTGAAPIGIAFALVSAIVYSAYVLVGSKLFAGLPPLATAATVMTSTAATYLTFAVARGQFDVPANSVQLGMIGLVALIGTAIPVLAFVVGMPRIGPSRASILSTFEPAVTVLLATAVLAEPLRMLQLAGAACIVASVVVLEAGRGGEPAQM